MWDLILKFLKKKYLSIYLSKKTKNNNVHLRAPQDAPNKTLSLYLAAQTKHPLDTINIKFSHKRQIQIGFSGVQIRPPDLNYKRRFKTKTSLS